MSADFTPPVLVKRCHSCSNDLTDTDAGWRSASGVLLCDRCYEGRQRALELRSQRQREACAAAIADLVRRYPRFRDWTLENYPATDPAGKAALELTQRWLGVLPIDDDVGDGQYDEIYDDPVYIDQRGRLNLYIHGPVGAGKTSLAWSALIDVIDGLETTSADFVIVRDLLAAARRSYSDRDAPDPLDDLVGKTWLVLDDLGAERPTDWALEAIATLIEERYVGQLQTIVTSNYSPSDLIARLGRSDPIIGQRIVSRLVESCLIVTIDRGDLRLKKAA